MQQQARQSERKREPLPCAKKRRGIISKRQKRFDVRRSTTFFFEQKKSQNENSLSLFLSLSLSLSIVFIAHARTLARTRPTRKGGGGGGGYTKLSRVTEEVLK